MTYRNNLQSAHARIATLERENKELSHSTQLALESVGTPESSNGSVAIRSQRKVSSTDEQEAFVGLFDSEFNDTIIAVKDDALSMKSTAGLTHIEATLESDAQGNIALRSEAGLRKANTKTYLGAVLASPVVTIASIAGIDIVGEIAHGLIKLLGNGGALLAIFGSGIVGAMLVARFLNKRRTRRVLARLSRMHYRWLKGQTQAAEVPQLASQAQYRLGNGASA